MLILTKDLPEDLIILMEDFCETENLPQSFILKELNPSSVKEIDLSDSDRGEDHALAMSSNLPPIIVAHGWLMDGRHRLWLAQKNNKTEIFYIDISELITHQMFLQNKICELF